VKLSRSQSLVALGFLAILAIWAIENRERRMQDLGPVLKSGIEQDVGPIAPFSDADLDLDREPVGDLAKPILIHVVREQGKAPIPDAFWTLLTAGGEVLLEGSSDSLGRIELPVSTEGAQVAVKADGYLGQRRSLVGLRTDPKFELAVGRSIAGSFSDYWGSRSPAGVLVVAYDSAVTPPSVRTLIDSPTAPYRGVFAAKTDGNGEFTLSGLRPNAMYSVLALGDGIVSDPEVIVTNNQSAEVELFGGGLRVACIRLIDSVTRESLSVDSHVNGHGVGVRESYMREPEVRPARIGASVLSDLCADAPSLNSWAQMALATLVPFEKRGAVDVTLDVDLPGYESSTFHVAYKMPNDGPVLSELELRPLGIGWGELSVSFSGEPTVDITGLSEIAEVRMIPQSNRDLLPKWLDFRMVRKDGKFSIRGIPAAEYIVSLRLRRDFVQLGGGAEERFRVSVEEGKNSRVEFDLHGLFDAKFFLSGDGADPYRGRFRGTLLRHNERDSRAMSFYFPGPPYTFIGLPEGEYSLMVDPPVMFPRPADPASAGAKFRVGPETAGIVHDLEVVF
jgi:hypothetical protein